MWEVRGGRARRLDMEAVAERVFGKLRPRPERDRSFDEWLAGLRTLDGRTRTWIRRYVEGFHAAETDEVGVQWLAKTAEESGGGGGEVRFHAVNGFHRAAEGLRARIRPDTRIHLNLVVREIHWTRHGAEVRCQRGPDGEPVNVWAPHVLVTLPLGVLQAAEGGATAVCSIRRSRPRAGR
jgi:hypothetical protein